MIFLNERPSYKNSDAESSLQPTTFSHCNVFDLFQPPSNHTQKLWLAPMYKAYKQLVRMILSFDDLVTIHSKKEKLWFLKEQSLNNRLIQHFHIIICIPESNNSTPLQLMLSFLQDIFTHLWLPKSCLKGVVSFQRRKWSRERS